jgi:hypothetical protein
VVGGSSPDPQAATSNTVAAVARTGRQVWVLM